MRCGAAVRLEADCERERVTVLLDMPDSDSLPSVEFIR